MSYDLILKWAAGTKIKISPKARYDNQKLLELIDLHDLAGRFLDRNQREKVIWINHELLEGLRKLHHNTRKDVMRNVQALNKLREMLPLKTQIIVIKGISIYVLCDQEEIMRAGDIDVLSNDTSIVIKALLKQGYSQTRIPFMHELGEYSKRGIEFDIHNHFPVYSYSSKLRNTNLVRLNMINIKKQNYNLMHHCINFNDLYQYAHRGKHPPLNGIIVPDPNLSAIIICAHAFMNYINIWSISHRKKAYVRLSEIADLFSLSHHINFDKKKFLKYVRRYRAQDAVEWAASVAISLLGENPLPINVNLKKGDSIPTLRFPRCLWWNFWVALPVKAEELLITNWMFIEKLTNYIGANKVIFSNGVSSSDWYSTLNKKNLILLKHFFTKNKKPISVSFNFQRTKKLFIIQVVFERTMKTRIDRVRVDLGKYATEWEFNNTMNKIKITGDKEFSSFHQQVPKEHKVVFKIGLDKLKNIETSYGYSLLVGVAKHNDVGKITASNLFPIRLKTNENN